MKKKITATVLSQKEIAPRIFDMWIATELAACAKAGDRKSTRLNSSH